MSKKLKHSLKHTLSTVALGAMVQSSGTQAQAQTPISVEHYGGEVTKILAGQSLAGQSNTPTTHIGGIFPTGEKSLVAGKFEKGNGISKITLATGGASGDIYGGIGVSCANQKNLTGCKISGIVGATNGKFGANIEASSERAKSQKPTSNTKTFTESWTQDTPTATHNFQKTTKVTQNHQIEGKSFNEVHTRVTAKIGEHAQIIGGVVHTTGGAVPNNYKNFAVEVGAKFNGKNGSAQILFDTNKNINGRGTYNIDDRWSVYAGASYQPQGEKRAHVGFGYSFGGGNNRGTTLSTPTRNNFFGAGKEVRDYVTGLLAEGVSDLSKLVKQQTRTIVTQKVTKNTTTKPTPPTTPKTPKETKIPKDFPTLDKPVFTPKPLVPHTREETLDLNNTSLNLTIPTGYTLDEKELAKNGGKLSVRNFYGAPRDEKDSELLLFTFDWDKKTNVLSNFLEEDGFVMHDGYLNLPLIDLNNNKINYKIFLDNLGSGAPDYSKDFIIKTQD